MHKLSGQYHNKSLIGLSIIRSLKKLKPNEYGEGKILDPQNGKTYSFNAKMSPDGKKLTGRADYIGVSMIGRDQTWHRIN